MLTNTGGHTKCWLSCLFEQYKLYFLPYVLLFCVHLQTSQYISVSSSYFPTKIYKNKKLLHRAVVTLQICQSQSKQPLAANEIIKRLISLTFCGKMQHFTEHSANKWLNGFVVEFVTTGKIIFPINRISSNRDSKKRKLNVPFQATMTCWVEHTHKCTFIWLLEHK